MFFSCMNTLCVTQNRIPNTMYIVNIGTVYASMRVYFSNYDVCDAMRVCVCTGAIATIIKHVKREEEKNNFIRKLKFEVEK